MRPKIVSKGCQMAPGLRPVAGGCHGALVVHHIKRRSQGGGNEEDNLLCLCDAHHRYVHDHPEWSRSLGLLR